VPSNYEPFTTTESMFRARAGISSERRTDRGPDRLPPRNPAVRTSATCLAGIQAEHGAPAPSSHPHRHHAIVPPVTGTLHYGTSSWSAKGWVGPFYPKGTKPGDFLAYYATQFSAVEADTTYYRVPDVRLVEGWDRKTPEGFRLAAKFPRTVVHGGSDHRPDGERVLVPSVVGDDARRFVETMQLLGEKLGPLLLQFPYFNRSAFQERAPFLTRLDDFLEFLPRGPRYAVEIRNKAWIDDELLGLLRARGVGFVLTEIDYMPHPAVLAADFDLVTTDFVYARLIGDRKATEARTKTFDGIVLDKSHDLDRWAALVRDVLARVPEVYAFANNHYAGHGPSTIRDLVARVEAGSGADPGSA
jgi:uncharacterized protein YecE (DUF72 family)